MSGNGYSFTQVCQAGVGQGTRYDRPDTPEYRTAGAHDLLGEITARI